MSFLISSFAGVGDIKFGMFPSEVRGILGDGFKSFKRTPNAEYPCDYYELLGIFVYYKLNGMVEAVEFTNLSELKLGCHSLFNLPFNDLMRLLANLDQNLEVEPDSLVSYQLGISLYAPNADENPSLPVESILVFEEGYY